jgi:hypothetical protein
MKPLYPITVLRLLKMDVCKITLSKNISASFRAFVEKPDQSLSV